MLPEPMWSSTWTADYESIACAVCMLQECGRAQHHLASIDPSSNCQDGMADVREFTQVNIYQRV